MSIRSKILVLLGACLGAGVAVVVSLSFGPPRTEREPTAPPSPAQPAEPTPADIVEEAALPPRPPVEIAEEKPVESPEGTASEDGLVKEAEAAEPMRSVSEQPKPVQARRPAPTRRRRPGRGSPEQRAKARELITKASLAEKLGKSDDPKAADELEKMIADADDYVKQYALTALVDLKGKEALPRVMEMAKSEHRAARLRAVFELGRIGDPAGAPVINGLLGDRNPILRRECVEALAKIRDRNAIPIIAGMLEDKDQRVRRAAQDALRKLTGEGFAFRRIEGKEKGKVTFKRTTPSEERKLWDEWWQKHKDQLEWDEKSGRWRGR